MPKSKNFKALGRAIGVMAAVMIVVGGVTFAALQSQQDVLAGNTIETATANLRISTDGSNYDNSEPGFDFNNLVPGGQAVPANGYPVYLVNQGGTPLALKLAVTSLPSNPDNVDLSKVNVIVTPSGGGSPQSFTLQSLINAHTGTGVSLNTPSQLMPNSIAQYTLQVSMTSDAVTGSNASLGNIDLAFSGVAQGN